MLTRAGHLSVRKACVSDCALARGFLVSPPPVSASWKPFPGAECRDRFASFGDGFVYANQEGNWTRCNFRLPELARSKTGWLGTRYAVTWG